MNSQMKRDHRISRKKTTKIERQKDLRIWKHIIMEGSKTGKQLIALFFIGIGLIVFVLAFIGTMIYLAVQA